MYSLFESLKPLKIMDTTHWIRSRAATGQPLNLHAVMRERPDLLEHVFAGPTPRGWRRSLIDAGVDPYKIVHAYEDHVTCAICGFSCAVLGTHIVQCHGTTRDEYLQEFGPDCEISSESFRAGQFGALPIAGIAHWENLWSRHYVTDWVIRLHEEGHNVNYQNLVVVGKTLASAGWRLFGSWDAVLCAAGLNPDEERAIPPFMQWTHDMVFDGLREFAAVKGDNWRRRMPNQLRMAIVRMFGTPEAASKAAGLKFEAINQRAIFSGKPVTHLVAAIRKLEHLKGRERRRKLSEIYHRNADNRRIIQGHFGSLEQLAIQEGIDPRAVSLELYRDEVDVHHDLNLLERAGKILCYDTLKRGHKTLYNVIRKTGWGRDRLSNPPRIMTKFPPCNPHSGLLQDRMILLRRKLNISISTAAGMAGITPECWSKNEKRLVVPIAPTIEKIEGLLAEHDITAHHSGRSTPDPQAPAVWQVPGQCPSD